MSFKAPIGTEEERISGQIWPPGWKDACRFLTFYEFGIHTGADLNLPLPGAWDADAHAPVYTMGDGVVTYAQRWPNPKFWGNIIVINHGIVDGKPLYSRYAHVENIRVSVGQLVRTGDQIAQIGTGPIERPLPFHLHFDISITDILLREPQNWPAPAKLPKKELVKQHYVDPRDWLRQTHVIERNAFTDHVVMEDVKAVGGIEPSATSTVWFVIALAGARVRKDPAISSEQVALLPRGSKLSLEAQGGKRDGFTWGHISGGEFHGCWLAICRDDRSEVYMSTNRPG